MIDLAFQPDRATAEPIYLQLSAHLRGLIDAERLPRGTKLPATRELASSLGLSRATVSLAYEELTAAGLVTAHVGQGTFVAERNSTLAPPAGADATASRGFVWSGLFALRARALALPPGFLTPHPFASVRCDFRGGQVDLESLPARELRRVFSEPLTRDLAALADHKDPFGWQPLRRAIAHYLVGRGIACAAEDVLVVNGAQQAIDLAARVLLDPGDTVVIEQPGYFGAWLAFGAAQANLVGVGVDEEGMRTDELARVLRARRVKLVYATPAAQSPTGAVLSESRRRTLLALADEHQVPILEDDYDSELRYQGAPIPALKTLDRAGQVIHAGTFSKVLFPGLRVGYVVAARALLEKMALARWNGDVETSVVPQAALAEMLASGGLERHLRRVRRVYAARLAAMLAALETSMPAGVRWTRPAGGHAVWLTLPPGTDGDAVLRGALAEGVAFTPGNVFHLDGRGGEHASLSFANVSPAAIADGIGILADVIRNELSSLRRKSAPTRRPQ